jgi:hypothetical protein
MIDTWIEASYEATDDEVEEEELSIISTHEEFETRWTAQHPDDIAWAVAHPDDIAWAVAHPITHEEFETGWAAQHPDDIAWATAHANDGDDIIRMAMEHVSDVGIARAIELGLPPDNPDDDFEWEDDDDSFDISSELDKLTRIEHRAEMDPDDSCSVCLEPYKPGDDKGMLSCNHEFHFACLERWFIMRQQPSCPLCREMSS